MIILNHKIKKERRRCNMNGTDQILKMIDETDNPLQTSRIVIDYLLSIGLKPSRHDLPSRDYPQTLDQED